MIRHVVIVMVGVGFFVGVAAGGQPAGASQGELLKVLQSDASLEQKCSACRLLGPIATDEAVGVLAGLLGDEKLSHVARCALEQMPGVAVDAALRQAATKLKGPLLAGVLNSIGARRDAQAVELLNRLVGDKDAGAASAAAFALGRIGNQPAAAALEWATAGAPEAVKPAIWDGRLRCAEALASAGQRQQAAALFDRLRAEDVPMRFRVAAIRGAVLARGGEGVGLLIQLLGEKDVELFNLALRLAVELEGKEVTAALAGQIAALPAGRQALLVKAMGSRGDREAAPAIRGAARHAAPAVRIAAAGALGQLGDPASLGALLLAARDADKDVAEAALGAVARLPETAIDAALVDRVVAADANDRLVAIECLARRQTPSAAPAMLKVAREGRPAVRLAARKALADVADVGDLPALTGLLMDAADAAEREASERTLIDICALAEDKDSCAEVLMESLGGAKGERKMALLRVLEALHSPKALQAVRAAAGDADADVQDLAIRALCTWQAPELADDLLALARDAARPNHRLLAIRGYIRLAGIGSVPVDKRVEMCERIAPLCKRDDEKRQLLGALGGLASAKALGMIAPYLDDPGVKEEACAAAVAVAGALADKADAATAAAAVAALEKVRKLSGNARTTAAAGKLLGPLRQRSGGK